MEGNGIQMEVNNTTQLNQPEVPIYLQSVGHPGQSLNTPQREFLVRLAEEVSACFPRPIIVNIGVQLGASMASLRAGSHHATLIGIDIDYEYRCPPQDLDDFIQAVYLEVSSHVACAIFHSTPHLVFVDGGHSYKTAHDDMTCWGAKLPPGGIIAIHDLHLLQVDAAFLNWYDPSLWVEIGDNPCPGFRAFRRLP